MLWPPQPEVPSAEQAAERVWNVLAARTKVRTEHRR